LELVDYRDNLIALRHRQRAPGAEIVLKVYQNQGIHGRSARLEEQ
jgi:hypothetical protein